MDGLEEYGKRRRRKEMGVVSEGQEPYMVLTRV